MWSVAAGVLLLGLLLADIYVTVLHPNGHGGPLNRLLTRVVWGSFRAVCGSLRGDRRDRMLSLGAPTVSAAILLVWVLLLVTGFAAVYLAFPDAFTHTQFDLTFGWQDAFYFSGVAASTLGMGDVLVEPGWLRVLTVVEAFMGFMVLTLSVTYVLSVYRAQSNAASFALEISSAVGDDVEQGIARLLSDLDSAERWAEAIARRLSQLTVDHAQFPVLHYFRPPDHRQATVPQAGTLLLLFQQLDERPGWEAHHPWLVTLRNVLGRYLVEVSRRFVHGTDIDVSEGDERAWAKRHRQAMRHLCYPEGWRD